MATPAQRTTAFWLRLTEPMLLRSKGHIATAKALRAARIARFPEWYLAMSYLSAATFGLAMGVLGAALIPSNVLWLRAAFGGAAALASFLVVRLGFLAYPRIVASSRARRIDEEIPSVVTLCYALARGGMNPLSIFRAVAAERSAYGEASVEFGVIVRNVEWFGMDLVTALRETSATTPSSELKGLLDGLVTILNSGAEPRDYFKNQAETRLKQSELNLEKTLEQTSLLAEIYVSGLLVLPLLLLVVLSGLSPLAPGQDALMPYVVFGMIPLGTAVYMLMLETMLPPEALAVPGSAPPGVMDFGMHSLPTKTAILPPPWRSGGDVANASRAMSEEELRAAQSLRWRLYFERVRASFSSWVHRMGERMIEKPLNALEFSGFWGLLVAGAAGYWVWTRGLTGAALGWAYTGVALLGVSIAFIPVAVFHEMRLRRARKIEMALPTTLNRLAGFNERGISLLQSFQILGNSSTGPLATELRAVGQDVTWNASLAGALRRLRQRINTLRMVKLGVLLERASAATGNLREVLDIAADDATRTEHLKSSKQQAMMSYVVVIYLVFAVFLYVLYVVANLFYGPGGLGAATAAGAGSAIRPLEAKILFAEAGVLQGFACGMVAGRLGEGHFVSGLKHAVFLSVAAFLVFHFGVL